MLHSIKIREKLKTGWKYKGGLVFTVLASWLLQILAGTRGWDQVTWDRCNWSRDELISAIFSLIYSSRINKKNDSFYFHSLIFCFQCYKPTFPLSTEERSKFCCQSGNTCLTALELSANASLPSEGSVQGSCTGPDGGGNRCSRGYGKTVPFYLFI